MLITSRMYIFNAQPDMAF